MADTELQLDDASRSNSAAAITDEHEPTRAELKEVLIDIQIDVNNILRDNIKTREEVVVLRTTIQQQQEELTKLKPLVLTLQQELEDARRITDEQEEEISQLYDLQDSLEHYTRNALHMHFLGCRVLLVRNTRHPRKCMCTLPPTGGGCPRSC